MGVTVKGYKLPDSALVYQTYKTRYGSLRVNAQPITEVVEWVEARDFELKLYDWNWYVYIDDTDELAPIEFRLRWS